MGYKILSDALHIGRTSPPDGMSLNHPEDDMKIEGQIVAIKAATSTAAAETNATCKRRGSTKFHEKKFGDGRSMSVNVCSKSVF